MPVMAFSVVVLPAPFAPIRLTSSPWCTSNDAPFTAWMPPYATFRPVTLSNVLAAMLGISFCCSWVRWSVAAGAEVGLDHLWVRLHFGGGAFGDLLSVGEPGQAVA